MERKRHRVGFVGVTAGQSWAALAHIPALRRLADDFEIIGVANSTAPSARAAAQTLDIPQPFESVDALLASPDIDIVVVTVKVPHHHALVSAALAAGKHVYCEWPLGNGLAEARDLAAQARAADVLGVVGMQGPLVPEVAYVRELIKYGRIGEVVSTSLTASSSFYGDRAFAVHEYLFDARNGATMTTITLGHALAALTSVLGSVESVSARTMIRWPKVMIEDTGKVIGRTMADQVLAHAQLASGAPLMIHYRGGTAAAETDWLINGTLGDLRIRGGTGAMQVEALTLLNADRGQAWAPVTLPGGALPDGPMIGNVGNIYAALAHDLNHGTSMAPRFDDAVRNHELLAAIEASSCASGREVRPDGT